MITDWKKNPTKQKKYVFFDIWNIKIVWQLFFEWLRGQTVHFIVAQFCVYMFLDSRDKS